MKKMVISFVLVMMAAVTLSVSANAHKDECMGHNWLVLTTHVATQ